MNKGNYYQDYLEWEVIDPDHQITNLSFEENVYALNSQSVIVFKRNDNHDLIATISGITQNANELKSNDDEIPGTFAKNETIIGYSLDGLFRYTFIGVVIEKCNLTPISLEPITFKFNAVFAFDRIEKVFNGLVKETDYIQEWFLSGSIDIIFPRSTTRQVTQKFQKIRKGSDSENENRNVKSSGFSWDHLVIKMPAIFCIVSQVPKQYGPGWAHKMSIEYRKTDELLPSREDREAIAELVSFILGIQLLKIGQTTYDSKHNITIQEYCHPWGENVMAKCSKGSLPPIQLRYNRQLVEDLLNLLTPQYIKLRPLLKLNDVLWKFWFARDSTLGTNLPILSSALETLSNKILKHHPDKELYYIEPNEFVKLIESELNSIQRLISNNPFNSIILNKIKGSSQRGPNEKLVMMFEILGLSIGDVERKAIRARNKMVHSSMGNITIEELKKTIRLTRAYETLFHRVILKLLGYNGVYIDYYSLGHPSRHINQNIPDDRSMDNS